MADKDKDLTHLFVRDLDDIPLPSRDRWRPAPRKESLLMKSSRYVLYAGAIAAVLVVALIASFQLRDSNPVAASPSPSASTSPAPTATASPTASAAATPIGFVLPADCSYVYRPLPPTPAPATPVTFWEFTCVGAATPDLMAVQRIAPAFAAQGWTPCPSNPGSGLWWKGAVQTMVGQGSPYPGLSQLARQSQDCPGDATGAITPVPTPTQTPTPTAVGFTLPSGCSYVGPPVVGTGGSQWQFDCGSAANNNARGTLAPAFAAQSWISCGGGLGSGTWMKGDLRLIVTEGSGGPAPAGLPTLTQPARGIQTACG